MKKSLIELIGEGYPLKEKIEQPVYNIYCDMDGVLTNFEKQFFTKLKEVGPDYYSLKDISNISKPKDFEDQFGTKEFWNFIDNTIGLSFWSTMEWMPGGKELWDFISPYNPQILTSPSKHNTSRLGKNLWVRDHIDPKPNVIFAYSSDKQRYSNQYSILIDDKKSNIDQWAAKGGTALRCVYGNINPVIDELKQLGYE